jgi:hypothetical protein
MPSTLGRVRVNEPPEPDPAPVASDQGTITDDGEVLDAFPVFSGAQQIVQAEPVPGTLPGERRTAIVIPAVQAAAVAAGGFVAGAAVVGLVHRHQRRSPARVKGGRAGRELGRRGARGTSRAGELLQIVSSRSLLVDVHLLGGSGGDR